MIVATLFMYVRCYSTFYWIYIIILPTEVCDVVVNSLRLYFYVVTMWHQKKTSRLKNGRECVGGY